MTARHLGIDTALQAVNHTQHIGYCQDVNTYRVNFEVYLSAGAQLSIAVPVIL